MKALEIRPELFLRAPFYSFERYDLADLPEVLCDPVFRNALWLASPAFYAQLAERGFDWERLPEKARHTLAKYYNRMSFRPTPFGAFASFTNLAWGATGTAVLTPDFLLHVLPDLALSQGAFRPAAALAEDTPLTANPTLYRLGPHYRYYRSLPGPKNRFRFTLDQEEAGAFSGGLLRQLNAGPVTVSALAGWVGAATGCGPEEAREYLRYLVEEQFLFSPAQGQLIGAPDKLKTFNCGTIPELAAEGSASYTALERSCLSGGPPATCRDELARALSVLQRLAPPPRQPALQEFTKAFSARFDLEQVPLLLALDPDAGIAYDRPATAAAGDELDEVRFPAPREEQPLLEWNELRKLFLRRWLNEPARGCFDPITLEDDDLQDLPESTDDLPPGLAVMFRLTNAGLLIEQAAGASALQLAARFNLFSDVTLETCRAMAAEEAAANSGVLLADLGQLSDTHTDNINRRRPSYEFEIPVNVYSSAPQQQQLRLSDLLLSVRRGELILQSRSKGKRVIPRLSSAFNYHHNELPLFRFLCDLQYQGLRANLGMDLSALFPGLPFYPRVMYRNTILRPAEWHFGVQELASLRAGQVALFRERYGLPDRITTGSGDQQLVFNLTDPAETEFLLRCLEGQRVVIIQEYLLPDRSVQVSEKSLAGQYVAFVTNPEPVWPPVNLTGITSKVKRFFTPGSDWLYVKLYCTPAAADRVLDQVIRPLTKRLKKDLSCWFFIRYADPGHQIRLRMKSADPGSLLLALERQLRRSGFSELVSDLCCEPYRRELERYGPKEITVVEEVFCAGSELALRQLSDPDEFGKAIRVTSAFLNHWFKEHREKLAFTERMAAQYLAEFNSDKSLKLDLDKKYRELRPRITSLLKDSVTEAGLTAALSKLHPHRKNTLLADLIHMQLNRTFSYNQRRRELLVYYCLHKYWKATRPDPAC